MNSKIVNIAAALMMGFTFSAFAGTPKEENKENKETKTESTSQSDGAVEQSGTALFLFNGAVGEENDPSKYETTSISNPEALCEGGSRRCAATFQIDGNGNRIGNPQLPVHNKD